VGILFLNVLAGGVIGGIVLAGRLLLAAVYLAKAVAAIISRTVRKLTGKPCRA